MFLWLIFLLIIAEFFYILLFQREKPIKSKQFAIRSKNGKKVFIILSNR